MTFLTNLLWALSGILSVLLVIYYASWKEAPPEFTGSATWKKLKAQIRLSWESFLRYFSLHLPPTIQTFGAYIFFIAGWWLNGIDLVIQFVQWLASFAGWIVSVMQALASGIQIPEQPVSQETTQEFFIQGQITILAPVVAALLWYMLNQRYMKKTKPHGVS